MTEDITTDLEAMIDKHGLMHVVVGLSLICSEKAEHLRSNWQDSQAAKLWDRDAAVLESAAGKVSSS